MPTLGDVITMTVEEPTRGEFRSFPARCVAIFVQKISIRVCQLALRWMCALPTIISYVFQCFQRNPMNLACCIIAITIASHPVLIYSLNHIAVLAKLLLSIEETFTVIFSSILVCISRRYTGDKCDWVAFNLDSALKVTVCPLTWKELL